MLTSPPAALPETALEATPSYAISQVTAVRAAGLSKGAGSLTTALARKALAAGILAVSAELIGSEQESLTTGRLAGELALRAGLSLDDLWVVWPAGGMASASWSAAVDGYYDTRDITEGLVGALSVSQQTL